MKPHTDTGLDNHIHYEGDLHEQSCTIDAMEEMHPARFWLSANKVSSSTAGEALIPQHE